MIDLASARPAQVQGCIRDVLKKSRRKAERPPRAARQRHQSDERLQAKLESYGVRIETTGWVCRKRYGRRLDRAPNLCRLPS